MDKSIIGYKNVEDTGREPVYRPISLDFIKGLYFENNLVGYRIRVNGELSKDISLRVLNAFKWSLIEDRKLTLREQEGMLISAGERRTGIIGEDISTNFDACVKLLRAIENNKEVADNYTIEDIKRLAKVFYNHGGDVIIECWGNKELQELIDEDTVLEDLAQIIDERRGEIEDTRNGEGYYW